MSPSNQALQPNGHEATSTQLSENFVLLDNSSGSDLPSLLYVNPVEVVEAWRAKDVSAALKKIESAVAEGAHAAGFLSYELGYALEPRLSRLMPDKRNVRSSGSDFMSHPFR